jgi:transposase
VHAGRQAKQTAPDLGIHPVTLHSWLRQDDIDQGRRPGRSTQESAELRAATWLEEEEGVAPKGRTR